MPTKIVLTNVEPGMNPSADELAMTVLSRIGLMPRKRGSTEKMHNVLLELYERSKVANRDKKPESAVITVEEMATHAGITRQTMYDYLGRWLELNLIAKTSYIKEGKVIIGYKLNGGTLEQAFERAVAQVSNHLSATQKYIQELQKMVKNAKISQSQKINQLEDETPTENL